MSKSKKHNQYFIEEDDEDFYGSDSDYRNRKKEKRISTALKRKNIDELIDLTEEDEY